MTQTTTLPVKRKILVIEDCVLTRSMISTVVKKMDFDLYEAGDGNVGVAAFRQENPDIVLTDILMPNKAGLVTITEIRKINARTPIIAMSSDGEGKGFLDLAEEIGAHYRLKKPFTAEELTELLTSIRDSLAG